MTGSLVYLLFIIIITFVFIITSKGMDTAVAIVCGAVVLFLSCGPGVLLWQIERKHNKEWKEMTPVVKPVEPEVTDSASP